MKPSLKKRLTLAAAIVVSVIVIAAVICHSLPFAALVIRHRSYLELPPGTRMKGIGWDSSGSLRAELVMSESQYSELKRQIEESGRLNQPIDTRAINSVCKVFRLEYSDADSVYRLIGRGKSDIFGCWHVWVIAKPPDGAGSRTVYVIIF